MRNIINEFIKNKELGLIGASRNKNKWGNILLKELMKKGYNVHPVNPNYDSIEGIKCYSSVRELPKNVKNVIIALKPKIVMEVVKECYNAGIKRIWLHKGAGGQGSQSKEVIEFCSRNKIELVHSFCPLMFFHPAGFHKLHFWFNKLFGKLPEEFK